MSFFTRIVQKTALGEAKQKWNLNLSSYYLF